MSIVYEAPGVFSGKQFGSYVNMNAPGGVGGAIGAGGAPGVAGNGVSTGGGLDKLSLAMLLMNALGTGVSAYTQAQQAKKDREFRERQYNEGADVRAEGRQRLLQPANTPEAPQNPFQNQSQPMPGNVAAPPPVGPNARRDEELMRILRARLGGQYE